MKAINADFDFIRSSSGTASTRHCFLRTSAAPKSHKSWQGTFVTASDTGRRWAGRETPAVGFLQPPDEVGLSVSPTFNPL